MTEVPTPRVEAEISLEEVRGWPVELRSLAAISLEEVRGWPVELRSLAARSREFLLDPDPEAERRWNERLDRVFDRLDAEFERRLSELKVVGEA